MLSNVFQYMSNGFFQSSQEVLLMLAYNQGRIGWSDAPGKKRPLGTLLFGPLQI